MKIIHTADLHIDSKIDSLSPEKSKVRREEIIDSFVRLCEYANTNNVQAVIISGDMFDTSHIFVKTKGRVFSAIKKCENTKFFCIYGNHDADSLMGELADKPENLIFFTDEWKVYNFNGITISGIDLNRVNSISVYDNISLNENDYNIVAMHGMIAGYVNTNEDAEIISVPRLKGRNINYLALGHYHTYNEGVIDERGCYAYSGCLDGRGFDETGVKGFVLLDVQNGKCDRKFIPFSSRVLYEDEYVISTEENSFTLANNILNMLKEKYSQDSLVKLTIKGEHNTEFEINKEKITSLLNGYFFFAKVYDKTELSISKADYETDKSARGEFIKLVMESKLDKEIKDAVIFTGLNAIKGEEF